MTNILVQQLDLKWKNRSVHQITQVDLQQWPGLNLRKCTTLLKALWSSGKMAPLICILVTIDMVLKSFQHLNKMQSVFWKWFRIVVFVWLWQNSLIGFLCSSQAGQGGLVHQCCLQLLGNGEWQRVACEQIFWRMGVLGDQTRCRVVCVAPAWRQSGPEDQDTVHKPCECAWRILMIMLRDWSGKCFWVEVEKKKGCVSPLCVFSFILCMLSWLLNCKPQWLLQCKPQWLLQCKPEWLLQSSLSWL